MTCINIGINYPCLSSPTQSQNNTLEPKGRLPFLNKLLLGFSLQVWFIQNCLGFGQEVLKTVCIVIKIYSWSTYGWNGVEKGGEGGWGKSISKRYSNTNWEEYNFILKCTKINVKLNKVHPNNKMNALFETYTSPFSFR